MNIHQPQTKSETLDRLPERLHHFGFVVKDQEVNRQFFEDVLGIPLVATWCERAHNVVVGREINYCHTFYALADGGALAFFQFEDADAYEALKPHRPDVGHHFAMKVDQKTYDDIVRRLNAAKIAVSRDRPRLLPVDLHGEPGRPEGRVHGRPARRRRDRRIQEEGRAQRAEALARRRPPAEQRGPARRDGLATLK